MNGVLLDSKVVPSLRNIVRKHSQRRQGDSPQRKKRNYSTGGGGKNKVAKTVGAHAAGATQAVAIWTGTTGSETDSGATVECYNRYMGLNGDATIVIAHTGSGWEIITANCNDAS